MMNNKQFSIFMFMNLFKQTDSWLLAIEGMKYEHKQKLNRALEANRIFFESLECELDKTGQLEQFYEDGECFSRVLELIKNAETDHKKHELLMIMKEYSKGELKIIEDEGL